MAPIRLTSRASPSRSAVSTRRGRRSSFIMTRVSGLPGPSAGVAGSSGHGLTNKIVAAYHFLVLNYEPGDEIYVFGFSRGAFTARSFVGLLRNCGIMSRRSLAHIRDAVDRYESRTASSNPNSEDSRLFRYKHCPGLCVPGDLEWRQQAYPGDAQEITDLRIRYLGVWDTVGALGIPKHLKLLAWLNGHHQFHDTNLSSFVERARHALAADERRRSFEPGVWTNLDDLNEPHGGKLFYEQLIFPESIRRSEAGDRCGDCLTSHSNGSLWARANRAWPLTSIRNHRSSIFIPIIVRNCSTPLARPNGQLATS